MFVSRGDVRSAASSGGNLSISDYNDLNLAGYRVLVFGRVRQHLTGGYTQDGAQHKAR